MKNCYLFCIGSLLYLIFATVPVVAAGNQPLLFKTGSIQVEQNLGDFISTSVNPAETINGRYYRIMQFNTTPTTARKNELEQSGIKFLSYLPEKAYYVSVPFSYNRAQLLNQDIRSVVRVQVNYKLSENLLHPNFPSYALSDNDKRVDLVIQYFSDLQAADVLRVLEGKNLEIRSRYDASHLLHIRLDVNGIREVAALPYIKWMELGRAPSTPDDTKARGLHRANALFSDYAMGRKYDGTGVNVVLGDDGLIGPHIDFTGRLDNSNATGYGPTHGDMTGGILVGCGNLNPVYRGMATGSYLYNYNVGPYNHLTDMPITKTTYNVRIASTSYSQGFSIGNGCNEYNADSQTGDQILHQNPELMWVFSAGNNGTADCYNAGPGWGNITGGFKNGKNVIACGNLNYADVLEQSSSRGPAPDGRIKPDICANGLNQMSTDEGNTYQVGGGTSASSPGIAGITAQLYQAYRELNSGNDPEACLLKACMLNTAEDIGNPGPDYSHGWGRVNALRAVRTIEENRYFSDTISQGDVRTYTLNVNPGVAKLKVMLYWLDVEGDPAAAKALVNDLDLTVTDPFAVVLNPWILDHTPDSLILSGPATTGVDDINNMEQVALDNPANGSYTITVNGTNIPQGTQKFYIVYEEANNEITVTYPMGSESFVPGEVESIRWDSFGPNNTFDLEYSADSGTTWNTIQLGVAANLRFYDWTVPANITGHALVRVTRGSVSAQSEHTFSIMDVLQPNQISIDYACVDSMQISWTALPNATSYQVYRLGAKYMDSLGVATGTSFVLSSNYVPTTEEWFAVSAFGADAASGRRSIAVNKAPGLLNCAVAEDAGILSVYPSDGTQFSNCDNLTAKFITVDIQNAGSVVLSNIPVNYSINGGAVVTETYAGPLNPGGHFFFNFAATYDFTALGIYNLAVWTGDSLDGNPFNDTLNATIETIQGVFGLPWSENFESFNLCSTANDCELTVCPLINGFMNEANGNADDIDWRTSEGPTATPNTGPDMDHNPGTATGNYLYTEASGNPNPCLLKLAQLVSPCIDLTTATNPKLTFWYHMYGADMGELHVDIFDNGVWTNDIITPITGDQGNQWIRGSYDLTAYVGNIVKFRFRGITGGNTSASDIALDDFGVAEAAAVDANLTNVDPPNGSLFSSCDDLTSKVISISILNDGVGPLSNVPVSYQINGGTVVNETVAGPIAPGASLIYNFTATADFSAVNTYSILTWAADPNDGNKLNDTLLVSVQTLKGLYTLPWSEDFETFPLCSEANDCGATVCDLLNGFVNEPNGSVDAIDWRTDEDGTPSQNTGPTVDHNPGTTFGNYVYLEASNGCFFQEADLISPCIDLSGTTNPELGYWYHLFGANMGELHVDLYSNTNWINDIAVPVVGDQGDVWLQGTVNLSNYIGQIVKFRFRGITGADFDSDMALDDIGVYENTGILDPTVGGQLYVAPNPGNGMFTVSLNKLQNKDLLQLSVVDMQGRIAYKNTFTSSGAAFRTTLDLSSLSKGVYTLKAYSGSRMYQIKLCIL